MLSRTADNLYWTARYVERADFLARVIDSAHRLEALPASWSGASTEWESAIATSGAAPGFYERYGDANERTVCDYLVFNPDNPSSIRSCSAKESEVKCFGRLKIPCERRREGFC